MEKILISMNTRRRTQLGSLRKKYYRLNELPKEISEEMLDIGVESYILIDMSQMEVRRCLKEQSR